MGRMKQSTNCCYFWAETVVYMGISAYFIYPSVLNSEPIAINQPEFWIYIAFRVQIFIVSIVIRSCANPFSPFQMHSYVFVIIQFKLPYRILSAKWTLLISWTALQWKFKGFIFHNKMIYFECESELQLQLQLKSFIKCARKKIFFFILIYGILIHLFEWQL